jgi:hypothetical protein
MDFRAVRFPLLTIALLLGVACATVASHPCTKGGQPAFDDGKVGKGTKQCVQVKDSSGAYINQGKYVEWHPNGVRAIEGEYAGGFKTGKWIEWDDQGRKLKEKWFEGGNEVPGREEKPYNGLGPQPRSSSKAGLQGTSPSVNTSAAWEREKQAGTAGVRSDENDKNSSGWKNWHTPSEEVMRDSRMNMQMMMAIPPPPPPIH